jgi:hypothetical protein
MKVAKGCATVRFYSPVVLLAGLTGVSVFCGGVCFFLAPNFLSSLVDPVL